MRLVSCCSGDEPPDPQRRMQESTWKPYLAGHASWKELLMGSGVETLALPANFPDLNAYVERWVRSIKTECIRWLNFLGVGGLRRGVREYLEHYNAERQHQALGNFPLGPVTRNQKF